MELKRTIYEKLLSWKRDSSGKTALLIEGARRVGKSTIAKKFGKENYRSCMLVDFAVAPKIVKDAFVEYANNLDVLFQTLSVEYGVKLYVRNSLIIFDEVQMFPPARQAIKYLVADGRYDFIETGSLISIKENVSNIVIPSEEQKIRMYPLTFQEFLMAAGEDALLSLIRESFKKKKPLADAFHKRASRLIREYLIVGGMPQSVVAYFDNGRDFMCADRQKRQIIDLYRNDIKKIARKYRSKVSALFEYIPAYLSTHEKKVVLKRIDESGEFDRYDDPLFWLSDSMICNLCYRCTDPSIALALNRDDSAVKCYLGDTGLLVSLAFSESELESMTFYRKILTGSLSINEGMFHENLVAQTISCANRSLYFYTRYSKEKHRNDMEIDFLLSMGGATEYRVDPVEVKSSKNYSAISLERFNEAFGKRVGQSIIVHPRPLSMKGDILRIPTYMFFCLFE